MILYDSRKSCSSRLRDPIGIRPLFIGYSDSGCIAFASEAKKTCSAKGHPFPIGSYYCKRPVCALLRYCRYPGLSQDELPEILANIREKLVAGVAKRLDADTPWAFCFRRAGIPARSAPSRPKTGQTHPHLAIGMSEDAIDLKYTGQAADYPHADHTRSSLTSSRCWTPWKKSSHAGHLGYHHHPRLR